MGDKYDGRYPSAWSKRSVAMYEKFGREPDKTENGLWVEDVERESRQLVDWTMAELFALANNWLQTRHKPGTDAYYNAVRGKALLEDREATKWSESELDDWLLYERLPEKTPGGYFVNDPDRWVKDVELWNDSELVDLGSGYFGTPENNQLYILDLASERFNLPMGITFEDYANYIRRGIAPPVTENGVLVNDRNRAKKQASDLSDEEITAWLNDWIELPSDITAEARERFSGEWFWGKEEIKHWVNTGDIPEFEHDYVTYTDEQLRSINDEGAIAELERRHPPVVVEPDPEPEPEVVPEPEPEPVPEEPEPEEEPVEEEPVPEPEPEPEVVIPTLEIKDVIIESDGLYTALINPTVAVRESDIMNKAASKWSVHELAAWIRQEIGNGSNATNETITRAIRAHCNDSVDHWVDSELVRFLSTGELPRGFSTGILFFDRKRRAKHPADWSDDELRAACRADVDIADYRMTMLAVRSRFNLSDKLSDETICRHIGYGRPLEVELPNIGNPWGASKDELIQWIKGDRTAIGFDEATMLEVMRSVFSISPHYTDNHIYAIYRNGSKPAMTTNGVLKEDRLRDNSSPAKWEWEELKALAVGELEADFDIRSDEAITRARTVISIRFNTSTAQWGVEEVVDFLITSLKPVALPCGVFLNDPTRKAKEAIEWRDAELRAWLDGKIEATAVASEDLLWDEVYRRFRVPLNWYREDARSYVLKGVKVPSTPSGIYIRDRNRDHRIPKHWTKRELKAWARGQILPGLMGDNVDMVVRAAHAFNISTLLDDDSIKKRISDIHEESMTMTVKFVTDDLKSYLAGRKEAGDNNDKAAPYQCLLDRCINRVLRLDGEDFVQGWTELLNFFFENSTGVCSAKKMYIGAGQMAVTAKGMRNFQNMTSILMNTADSVKRDAAARRIEWTTALKEVPVEKSRQNILAYYGI